MSIPEKVKAIGIEKTGDFDVIQDLELPFPTPKPDEIVVKVEVGGVNFIDTYFRYVIRAMQSQYRS
jgi:NADPH2:quinone reductase